MLVVGKAPLDPRYECAQQETPRKQFRIFTYGGSTVFGAPVQELGFVEQLRAELEDRLGIDKFDLCNFGKGGRDSSGVVLDLKRTLIFQPDLLIVFTGHNEYLNRRFKSVKMRWFREWAADHLATIRMWNRLMRRLNRRFSRSQTVVMPNQVQGFDRSSSDFESRVRRYEENIKAIIDMSVEHGTPLILGTLPSNVMDWPPVFKTLSIGDGGVLHEELVSSILRLAFDGDIEAASGRLNTLSSTDLATPIGRYLQARLGLEQGRAGAAAELIEIKDLDPIPWRMLSRFNSFIRSEGSRYLGKIEVLDVERIFSDSSDFGVAGFDLIIDNCHPTPTGNRLIAERLLLSMSKLLEDRNSMVAARLRAKRRGGLQDYLSKLEDPQSVRLKYLLNNAIYAMKVPFYNYNASRMYLNKAKKQAPDEWQVWANLATLSILEGDIDTGKEQLIKAMKLGATPKALLHRSNAPYLQEALNKAGLNPAFLEMNVSKDEN